MRRFLQSSARRLGVSGSGSQLLLLLPLPQQRLYTAGGSGGGDSLSSSPAALSPPSSHNAAAPSTPHFPNSFTASDSDLADIGEIDTSPAVHVEYARDVAGPWLLVAGDLQGELFIGQDQVAHFRPAALLGYGIGRLRVNHSSIGVATFDLELEVYTYENIAACPPLHGVLYRGKGIIAAAHAPKKNYKTFTLHGTIRRDAGGAKGSEKEVPLNAARLAEWNAASQPQPWAPDPVVTNSLLTVFPASSSAAATLVGSRSRRPEGLGSLEPYRVGDIPDVFYIPNYVSGDESEAMLALVKGTPEALKSKLTKRVVQEWGCSMCGTCNQSFVFDGNLPPWTEAVGDLLLHDRIFTPSTFPNNVRIHEYEPGEGIAPHVDGPIYVPNVAILSLASACVLSFYPRQEPYDQPMEHYNDTFKFDGAIAKQRPHMSVVLEPGSLVVFSGEAYSHYPHGISDKLVDSLVEAVAGTVVNRHLLADKNITEVVRKYRVGVTVRNLLPRCNHSPERAEYAMRRAWSIFHKERLEATTGETPLPQPQQQQLSGGSVSRPSSGSGVASTSTVGHSPSAEQLTRIEAKLDAVLMQQTELRTAVREVQEVVSMTTAASSSFRAEMSSILNHMSATVLQIESSVDELVASSSSNTGDT